MNQLGMLDIISIVSFALQLQNNENLQKQTSNDEVIEKLHEDIVELFTENKKLNEIIISQNKMIIKMIGGEKNARSDGSKQKINQ